MSGSLASPGPEVLARMDAIASRLGEAKTIVLTTHVTPDGDGLGAALALCRHLRGRGKQADVINCSTAPNNLRFLYEKGEFHVFSPEKHGEKVHTADAIVATDIGGSARLGKMLEPVRRSRATRIVLDHHVYENDIFDLPLIVIGASSSAEITWRLIRHMGGEITRRIAEPLYVGLITDTGNFSYAATSPEAHYMAAALVETGVDPHDLWRRITCTVPLAKMRFLGLCLSRLRLECDGRLVWTAVDGDFLKRSELPARDAFEVVNHMLHLQGVLVGAFFMEISQTRTKVSLRSAGDVDVSALAARHGGGGHRFAAGCTVEGKSLNDTISLVLGEIAADLGASPAAAAASAEAAAAAPEPAAS